MMHTGLLIEGYRTMLLIRRAEEALAEDFVRNKIFSFLHLSIGQEAVAAGVCKTLTPKDAVFGNHRSHAHYLAKGGDLYRMFAEIYGKQDGCCRGRGGSMHLLDRTVGFMGSAPILGSIVPIACGHAFAQKQQEFDAITVVFFGDGASEEGVVYESLNLAALYRLPVLCVIENNHHAVNSAQSARRATGFDMQKVVRGLGVDYAAVDGNDYPQVYDAAASLRYSLPAVLEARTYRQMAHSGPVCDESARQIDPLDVRKANDPLALMRARLSRLLVSDADLDTLDERARSHVSKMLALAKAAQDADMSTIMEGALR